MHKDKKHKQVFICYAIQDEESAKALSYKLSKTDVTIILGDKSIPRGAHTEETSRKNIETSNVVLVLLSKKFISTSGSHQKQLRWAIDQAESIPQDKNYIVPIILESCEIPNKLAIYQSSRLFTKTGEISESEYKTLLSSIYDSSTDQGTFKTRKENIPPDSKNNIRFPFKNVTALIAALAPIIVALIGIYAPSKYTPQINTPPPTFSDLDSATPGFITTSTVTPTITVTSTKTATPTPATTSTKTITPTPTPRIIFIEVGAEMVLIPVTIIEQDSDLSLNSFYMDSYEVTNSLYKICVDSGVCPPPRNRIYYDNFIFDQHPVVYVTWNMAKKYCEWRGENTRLPTEAEWEYAARGVDGQPYPWGNIQVDCEFANYYSCGHNQTTRVGSYEKGMRIYYTINARNIGLYDLVGNVWEWVDTNSSINTSAKIIKGGAWNFAESYANLMRDSNQELPINSYNNIGFRCIRSIP